MLPNTLFMSHFSYFISSSVVNSWSLYEEMAKFPFKHKVNITITSIEIYLLFSIHVEILFLSGKFMINLSKEGQIDNTKPKLIKDILP